MEVVNSIVRKIVEQINRSMGHQIGYLVQYKENIEKLKGEVERLRDVMRRVQERVNRAKNNAEIIEDDVFKWLTKVHGIQEEVDEFLEKTDRENMRCFKGWCPDIRSHYQLGKEAKKKTEAVNGLKEGSNFDTIAHRAPLPEFGFTSATDYEHFDSRALVFNKIKEALEDDVINIIGVYGMGGVGKTTLVEEVSKQAKKDMLFDEVVMAVVSQNVDVRKIEGELADRLSLEFKAETEVGRAGELCNRLKNGKKILVIIDDIWKEINLKEIGIPFRDGVKGCKVVLTSRSRGVCSQMKVQKEFLIEVILEHEAWALFEKKVGNFVDSSEMYFVAKEVCRECKGLPIAILSVAGVLIKYRNKYAWDDVLEQLRNSRPNNIEGLEATVYSSLELSYTHLEPADAKRLFLLCCLFPEDAKIPINDLVMYGMGMGLHRNVDTLGKARNRVRLLVDTLKASCLLLDGKDTNIVKMHDVIRDVAMSIAFKEGYVFEVKSGFQEWPEIDTRCTAISLRSMHIHELPSDLECPELHTLVLEGGHLFSDFIGMPESIPLPLERRARRRALFQDRVKVPDNFFNGMKKLEVLVLTRMDNLSLSNLVNLRVLCVTSCSLVDISLIKELKKLEILILNCHDVKELAPEIAQLTRLRLLDLRDSMFLTVIPPHVISSLTRLEELYISHRFEQWEVEAPNRARCRTSLVELDPLTRLTVLQLHIPNVTVLPQKLLFQRLIRFRISVGKQLDKKEYIHS